MTNKWEALNDTRMYFFDGRHLHVKSRTDSLPGFFICNDTDCIYLDSSSIESLYEALLQAMKSGIIDRVKEAEKNRCPIRTIIRVDFEGHPSILSIAIIKAFPAPGYGEPFYLIVYNFDKNEDAAYSHRIGRFANGDTIAELEIENRIDAFDTFANRVERIQAEIKECNNE